MIPSVMSSIMLYYVIVVPLGPKSGVQVALAIRKRCAGTHLSVHLAPKTLTKCSKMEAKWLKMEPLGVAGAPLGPPWRTVSLFVRCLTTFGSILGVQND